MDLNTIRIVALFALTSILFVASYHHITSAETIMCKKDTKDTKSCKGSLRTDVFIVTKIPIK